MRSDNKVAMPYCSLISALMLGACTGRIACDATRHRRGVCVSGRHDPGRCEGYPAAPGSLHAGRRGHLLLEGVLCTRSEQTAEADLVGILGTISLMHKISGNLDATGCLQP